MNSQTDYSKFWSPAFDTMDDFIFLIDTNFTIRKVNQSFLSFIKKNESDLTGKKCYEVVHSSTHPVTECPHMRMLTTKKFESSEYYEPFLKKWLYVRTTPIFDVAGNLMGSIHLMADVTKRKMAEEDLRKKISELERFQKITVGRELKMKELKARIAELEAKINKGQ